MSKRKRRQTPKKERSQPKWEPSTLREYFTTLVICTVAALFVTTYVVHPMSVPTPSMEPTILIGDRILVDKFTIRNGYIPGLPLLPIYRVQRQDIIVCKAPLQPDILLVKRIIGLPGETLEIRDKTVYIDGKALEEPYKMHSDPNIYSKGSPDSLQGNIQRDNFPAVTIPKDSYFVMGDNRDDSLDSRYWRFLPKQYIVGRPLFIFWSYQDAPDSHLKTSPLELIQLYGERVLFFFTRTRWSRMGRLVR